MNKQNTILIIIIALLIASNVFFGVKYISIQKEFQQTQTALETQKAQAQFNEKNLEFTKLFIQKVLKAETEVDFEARLKLENSVRDLEDEEILSQWNKFIDSKTDDEAQTQEKNLLEILVDKIRI